MHVGISAHFQLQAKEERQVGKNKNNISCFRQRSEKVKRLADFKHGFAKVLVLNLKSNLSKLTNVKRT